MSTHTLYISRATSAETFEFITRTSEALFNCNWQMHAPYDEPQTHNIYCDVSSSLDTARAVLARAAAEIGKNTDWQLIPDRI